MICFNLHIWFLFFIGLFQVVHNSHNVGLGLCGLSHCGLSLILFFWVEIKLDRLLKIWFGADGKIHTKIDWFFVVSICFLKKSKIRINVECSDISSDRSSFFIICFDLEQSHNTVTCRSCRIHLSIGTLFSCWFIPIKVVMKTHCLCREWFLSVKSAGWYEMCERARERE